MVTCTEGIEISVDEIPEWSALSPNVGEIVRVYLKESSCRTLAEVIMPATPRPNGHLLTARLLVSKTNKVS